ncbi:M23 family metallopeptidase [Thalassospira marina]|uniref:Peptidase M23 n=1 Tax=Thalassospira marina TaxID=2048283 RepID=A0A2N3KZ86_9PROT|nr:M23 family metallopeptidase [Thalassospira marina]AUG51862.1 peptidase M23 [Thalassospira marina]PKR55790.1 peptidase M23 [Thalassospira marina]
MRSNFVAVALTLMGVVITAPLAARADEPAFKGSFTQGGIVFGETTPGTKVELDGEKIDTVAPDGNFVLGFSRDYEGPATVTLLHGDGSTEQFTYPITHRTFDIQRIDGLPKKMVTPDPAVMERIHDDSRQAREARVARFDQEYYNSGFIWPATGRISGVYGSQRILNGEPRAPHWGVDIAVPSGTPIVAPADGVVTLAHPDMYFSGATLFVDHGLGVVSAFLHLSKIDVKVGDVVHQGDVIAHSGASGRATGPHLDWRVNVGPTRIDAALLVPPMEQVLAGAKK